MRCNEDVEQNLRERYNLSQYFHSTINSYFCVIKVKAVAQLFWMMMKAILRKRRRILASNKNHDRHQKRNFREIFTVSQPHLN